MITKPASHGPWRAATHKLAGTVLLFAAPLAGVQAAVFCVDPTTDLATIFQTVASNGQSDQVRFVQGVHNIPGSSFGFSVPGDVELVGGYVPGCMQRSANPALTVINGGLDGQLRYARMEAQGSLLVTGMTFTGFIQIDFGRGDWGSPATGSTIVERNLFHFNDTSGSSGALVVVYAAMEGPQGEARTIVRNNVFRDNVTGAALTINHSGLAGSQRAIVTNNTFVANALGGPAIDYWPSLATARNVLYVHNNIVGDNGPAEQVRLADNVLAEFRSNLVQRCGICGVGSNGNLVAAPQFEDALSLRPAAGSPARNAGFASAWTGTLDYAGSPRVLEGTVDIGAVEYVPPLFANGFE